MMLNLKGSIKNIVVGILNLFFLYFIANFCKTLFLPHLAFILFIFLAITHTFLLKNILNRFYTPKIRLYKFLFLQYTIFVIYIFIALQGAFLKGLSLEEISPSHGRVGIVSFCLAVIFGLSWMKYRIREKREKRVGIMTEAKDDSKIGRRPIIITVICIWIFLYAVIEFLSVVVPAARSRLVQQCGVTILPIVMLTSILDIAAGIGYWKMRKWGVYLYIVAIIVGYGGCLLHYIKITIFDVIPFVIIGIGLAYFKRMR